MDSFVDPKSTGFNLKVLLKYKFPNPSLPPRENRFFLICVVVVNVNLFCFVLFCFVCVCVVFFFFIIHVLADFSEYSYKVYRLKS